MDRRGFLQSAAAAALTATADRPAKAFATATQKMIGIQIGAVSFADEGTERVLDELQQDALIDPSLRNESARAPGTTELRPREIGMFENDRLGDGVLRFMCHRTSTEHFPQDLRA